MMYPYTVIDEVSPNNIYTVDSGSMLAFPITLGEEGVFEITPQHVAMGIQDHSLRLWVSREIGGPTLGRGPTERIHPNRTPKETLKVYDAALDAPDGLALALEPGDYYVNVLNLVNSRNALSFLLTDLT